MLENLLNSEYCKIFKSTYFEKHLRTAASKNVHETDKGQKLLIKILTLNKKQDFSTSLSETSKNVCLFVFISFHTIFF